MWCVCVVVLCFQKFRKSLEIGSPELPKYIKGHSNIYTKSLFALSSTPEVMWSIMASFMLYVVDKFAWDFYMENV